MVAPRMGKVVGDTRDYYCRGLACQLIIIAAGKSGKPFSSMK
jgi:hypothetical protein